jgi:hypothetical protein
MARLDGSTMVAQPDAVVAKGTDGIETRLASLKRLARLGVALALLGGLVLSAAGSRQASAAGGGIPAIWLTHWEGPGQPGADPVPPYVKVNGKSFTVGGEVAIGFYLPGESDPFQGQWVTAGLSGEGTGCEGVKGSFQCTGGSFGMGTELRLCGKDGTLPGVASERYTVEIQAYDDAADLWSNLETVNVCIPATAAAEADGGVASEYQPGQGTEVEGVALAGGSDDETAGTQVEIASELDPGQVETEVSGYAAQVTPEPVPAENAGQEGTVISAEPSDGGQEAMIQDTDGDGLSDGDEAAGGTDPYAHDTDGDGLGDGFELHPYISGVSPLDADTDDDGIGDAADFSTDEDPQPGSGDADGDGLDGNQEVAAGTDPLNPDTDADELNDGDEMGTYRTDPLLFDTDGDRLNDGFEVANGTDPLIPDTDGDGLSDGDERLMYGTYGTDPLKSDTDGDGLPDGFELHPQIFGVSPLDPDTDGDGIGDADDYSTYDEAYPQAGSGDGDGDGLADDQEVASGTDPLNPDTDGDGVFDGFEVSVGLSPLTPDTDGDGLSDYDELNQDDGSDPGSGDADGDGLTDGYEGQVSLTDPYNPDTDGDGTSDGDEINLYGTDPNYPDGVVR